MRVAIAEDLSLLREREVLSLMHHRRVLAVLAYLQQAE
jgi:hypothetical protein